MSLLAESRNEPLPATYASPTLSVIGSVRELTLSGTTSTPETSTGGGGCSANTSKRPC